MDNENEEDKPRVQADNNSIAVGGISIGGDISGNITIGHTGYTVEQVSVLLTQITSTFQPKPFDGRCPYKGLEVFEEEDAELFFGRERLVDDLLSRVKESRTVFITGPSGSGKSSLVRAGLIHALKEGAIKNLHSERWLYETMKPGREPIKDLALAFSRLKSPDLADYFQAHISEKDILNKCAESVLSGRKDQRFVLFIDQFEEVFTQISQEEERLAFLNMLAHAGTVENGRVIILFAMRSDFVSNCATYPALNELLSQQFRQIGAMQPEELVSAIALPAKHVGLPIEDELIARIINDMKGEPGALPLMQFALKDLFDSQQEKGGIIALTLEDYLRHGGIHKSLERHADNSFAKLSEEEQGLARSIFSGLIEIGRGTQDTRRTALFDDLIPANTKAEDIQAIVRKLADARLIITDEQAGKDTVTISHEKLIDAWPWLKRLVNENRDVIALQNEIAEDAREWEQHGRDASYMYSGARLGLAQEQVSAQKITLSGLAKDFIVEGITAREAERRTKEILRKRITIGLISGIAIALVLAGFAVYQMLQAQKQARIALARQLAAQAQSVIATSNSSQMIGILLATESMRIYPSSEAARLLLNNNLAALPVASMFHGDTIISVVFSPDGKFVAASSYYSGVRVWEATTGKEVVHLTDDRFVSSVAFSSNSRLLLSVSCEGMDVNTLSCRGATILIWEVATWQEVARTENIKQVNTVAFGPGGRYVVSSGCDEVNSDGGCNQGAIHMWEAYTGQQAASLIHGIYVWAVAFSLDGKFIVSGGCDEVDPDGICNKGTVRVWEAATGKEIAYMTHGEFVTSVAFSPDGKYVASSSNDGTARVWNIATGNEVARIADKDRLVFVTFSPDGRYVVLRPDSANTVWIAEAGTGKEISHMTHDNFVTSVAFSPDGKYVVSGSEDKTARVWQAATGEEVARMTHDDFVTSVAFSPDGEHVVSGAYDGTIRVWEALTRDEIAPMTQVDINSVSFSPDGRYVVSGGCDAFGAEQIMGCIKATAHVWDALTGKEVSRMIHDSEVIAASFSPDGKYVSSSSINGIVRVWEAATGHEVANLIQDRGFLTVALSPDGKYLAAEDAEENDYVVHIWEVTTGKEVFRQPSERLVSSVAFSPDGRYIVFGDRDGLASIWEVLTGKEVTHKTHEGGVTFVAFSPDGRYVVSSGSGPALVWEPATGSEIAHLTLDGSANEAAFSPDGMHLVSGSFDGTARVWEVATGQEVARLMYKHRVTSVAFSPDGRNVVSAGCDEIDFLNTCTKSSIRIWVWQASDVISNACARLPRNLTRQEWDIYIGDAVPYEAVCTNLPIEPEPTPISTVIDIPIAIDFLTPTPFSMTLEVLPDLNDAMATQQATIGAIETQADWTQTPVFSPAEINRSVTYTPTASP